MPQRQKEESSELLGTFLPLQLHNLAVGCEYVCQLFYPASLVCNCVFVLQSSVG